MTLGKTRIAIATACAAGMMMLVSPVMAQQAVMKECGAKWQAAKAAKQTGNQTWPQFLAKCRADSAKSGSKPADTKKADTKKADTKTTTSRRSSSKSASVAGAPAGIVFPTAVAAKYKTLSPGLARNKTCADQYNANKASGGKGNAGLLYIPKEKGGKGYWPLCNASLKK
jgi:hypothetical protein